MTKSQKKKFVRELVATVQGFVLEKLDQMPEEWDGHELRRYLADKFEESAVTLGRKGYHGRPYARRYRQYKNAVLERGL